MCAKNAYDTRREARAALRRHHDPTHTFRGCRAYLCECGGWHLGHVPADVRHGLVDRSIYDRSAA